MNRTTMKLTLELDLEIDGIYDDSLEDIAFEQATAGIHGVLDLSENCVLYVNSIELVKVER